MSQEPKKRVPILGILLLIAIAYYFMGRPYVKIYNGVDINTLFDRDSRGGVGVNCVVHQISDECLTISHDLFLFFSYTDHYCFAFNDDLTKCICIRTTKEWMEQFDESGFSAEGVPLKGYVQKAPWRGIIGFFKMYSVPPKEILESKVEYWGSVGFYPDVEDMYYIEPRPFFNMKIVSLFFDGVDMLIDAALDEIF